MPFLTIIIFGALAGCFALFLELVTSSVSFLDAQSVFSFQIFGTLLLIALIEEISKYTFLLQYQKYFALYTAIALSRSIILGIFFGIGFSSLEMILSWQSVAPFSLFSTMGTLLLHISTSLLLASFTLSLPKGRRAVSWKSLGIISVVVALHLGYNIALFLGE